MASELSVEQQQVLEPLTRVVEAGPGSGKTRALVARYIDSASRSDGGVAFLSFTNAAIDEVRRRTKSAPHLLRAPNFVGTIDSFLHRFIVTPAMARETRRPLLYTASWGELPFDVPNVRLRGLAGNGVRLSQFYFDEEGEIQLNESSLSRFEGPYLTRVVDEGRRNDFLSLASSRIRGLNAAGVYDAATARSKAYELISGPQGEILLSRITRRFHEVLLDEAQDCDAAELAIIKRLATKIRSLVVADPDQAIFEFRGGNTQLFLDYRDAQQQDHRAELSTNYRSSASICKVVESLRAAGNAPIRPSDESDCAPICVLSGDPTQQRDKFQVLLDEHGIGAGDAIVLAHGRSDAEAVAGRTPAEGSSRAIGDRLASCCATLKNPASTPTERKDAITRIEGMLLVLMAWPDELQRAPRVSQLSLLGKDREWLRRTAAALAGELDSMVNRDQFGLKARQVIGDRLSSLPIAHIVLSNRVKKPTQDVWDRCAVQAEEVGALICDTVHGAKGLEFPAVLIALPATLRRTDGKDVLDDWAEGRNTEARRVLYVGTSRAEQLLAFGAGPHEARLSSMLEADDVPVRRV